MIMSNPSEIYSPGLEGVIAGETAVSTITGGLRYRGYPVTELAEKSTFDEVAYLLLYGDLPSRSQLGDFNKRLAAAQKLPGVLSELLKKLPRDAVPMDVLRTGVSILANFDPDLTDNGKAANLRKSERLLAQIPLIIAEYYRATKGQQAVATKPELGFAANMLYMLSGKAPSAADTKAFDVSLILYAEHEFNASTFTAAIGAMKGPLHGGANEKVMDLLLSTGGPDKAEKWIRDALAKKTKVMGFGHRVYKTGDVRARVLKEYAKEAAGRAGTTQWETAAETIEKVMEAEKNLFPNLDWPAGRLYHAMGLEVPLYTPFFVASRVTGWSAHVIEQLEHNRIIRPRSRYTGPEEKHVNPIGERG
jgi:citrate synthase